MNVDHVKSGHMTYKRYIREYQVHALIGHTRSQNSVTTPSGWSKRRGPQQWHVAVTHNDLSSHTGTSHEGVWQTALYALASAQCDFPAWCGPIDLPGSGLGLSNDSVLCLQEPHGLQSYLATYGDFSHFWWLSDFTFSTAASILQPLVSLF